jgi:hypothetical protein
MAPKRAKIACKRTGVASDARPFIVEEMSTINDNFRPEWTIVLTILHVLAQQPRQKIFI